MKLNPKELKNVDYKKLALNHGEKVAIVVCGAIFVFGLVSFFRPKLKPEHANFSPTELREKVERAQNKVQSNAPPAVESEGPFATLAQKRLDEPVALTAIAWNNPFFRPPQGRGQRGEPKYLPPIDPVVSAGQVTVEVTAPAVAQRIQRVRSDDKQDDDQTAKPATRKVKPYNFVAVRFLVPLFDQIAEYRKANLGATMPFYLDFVLERQTLLSGGEWGQWEPVDALLYVQEKDDWVALSPDVVPPSAVNERLTAPLPARIFGDWQKHGGHPKLEQLALSPQQPQQQPQQQQQQPASKRKPGGFVQPVGREQARAPGGFGNTQMRRFVAQAPQGPTGQGQQGGPEYGGAQDTTGQGQQGGPGFGGAQDSTGQFQQGGGQPQRPVQPQGQRPAQPQGPMVSPGQASEWLLFRFLDLWAEPGKTYRYRLKLVLENPNFEVEQELLEGGNKELAKEETRETDWSEPSSSITVPDRLRYLVVNDVNSNDAIELDVFYIDPDLGTFVAEQVNDNPTPLKLPFERGDMIAIARHRADHVDLERNVKKSEQVDATTNDILLDFVGGTESLDLGPDFNRDARQVTLPPKALVMDAQGHWVTRNKYADQQQWFELSKRLVEEQNSAKEEKEEEEKNVPAGFQGQQGQGFDQGGGFNQGGGFQRPNRR